MITVLLHDLYPHLSDGAATVRFYTCQRTPVHTRIVKAQLVRDSFFAQISRRYKLQERIRCEPSQKFNLTSLEKPVANLFEAYVAGLFEAYTRGPASESNQYNGAFPSRMRSHGQAIDLLEDWIHPLFTPLAAWVLSQLQEEQARVEAEADKHAGGSVDEEDQKAVGSLARLNEYFISKEGTKPELLAMSGAPSGYWTMQCIAIKKDGSIL